MRGALQIWKGKVPIETNTYKREHNWDLDLQIWKGKVPVVLHGAGSPLPLPEEIRVLKVICRGSRVFRRTSTILPDYRFQRILNDLWTTL